jgi:hypothetical protein
MMPPYTGGDSAERELGSSRDRSASRSDIPRHPVLRCCYGAVRALCYRARGAMRGKFAGQHGDVAQLAERLLCKQGVVGSSPIISTTTTNALLSRGADGPSLG